MRIPDRFDLCLRKILQTSNSERQLDLILGTLLSKSALYFWNSGSNDQPEPASTHLNGELALLVYTDPSRLLEALDYGSPTTPAEAKPVPGSISMTPLGAFEFCLKNNAGLFINPLASEHNILVPFEHVKAYYSAWKESSLKGENCFWVPNITDEEEDFWQELGL